MMGPRTPIRIRFDVTCGRASDLCRRIGDYEALLDEQSPGVFRETEHGSKRSVDCPDRLMVTCPIRVSR